MSIRKAAVAGTWYPGTAPALAGAVDGYLAGTDEVAAGHLRELVALIAPHAGLIYSGPVAAHAYRQLRDRAVGLVVLVGPSHFLGFDGVSIYRAGGFETPLGVADIDEECASAIMAAAPIVHERPAAHAREHSLEMQLPFLKRVAPAARIVPLVVGRQTAETARSLGDALGAVLKGRNALLVASTDLSHYHDAATAARLDGVVIDHVSRFDADGLQRALDAGPEHACGGGPTVAVMRAARQLGARDAVILRYADSGDVSGDKSAVVGYLAAALGNNQVSSLKSQVSSKSDV
jgi:AmmeMemoRadiSam system protein B